MSQMPPMQPNYQGPMPGAGKPSGMGVASMVLGIVSFAVCWIPVIHFLTYITAILAIVLGIVARGKVKQGTGGGGGMAMAGMVLGIVYLSIVAIVWILGLLGLSYFQNIVNEAEKQRQKQQQGGSSMLNSAFQHVSALWNVVGSLVWR